MPFVSSSFTFVSPIKLKSENVKNLLQSPTEKGGGVINLTPFSLCVIVAPKRMNQFQYDFFLFGRVLSYVGNHLKNCYVLRANKIGLD